MDAHKSKLVSLFSGDEVKYVIPVYQRNYDWSTKQCRQLFNDLLSIINNEKEHFFGSIVIYYNRQETFSVIDGQQRLTTVSLMWLAMSKLIAEGLKDCTNTMRQNIANKYSYPSDKDENIRLPKIIHVEKDRKAFEALIKNDKDKIEKDSNITRNFNLFYEWIKASQYSIAEFDNAIRRLAMVKIELDANDNPQLIFESLNSTGLALSDGDKIRNFILMNLPDNIQKECYEKYWVYIEQYANYTGLEKDALGAVTNFVRDYLTSKTTHIPALRDVYSTFKTYAIHNEIEASNLLADMKQFALYLYEIENAKTKSSKLNRILRRLTLLEMTVIHPYIFNLLNSYYMGMVSEDDTVTIMSGIENFIFRRLICEVPTNALNKIFANLHGSAEKMTEKEQVSYVDAVIYLLTSRPESSRFPSDDEFRKSFAEKNIYNMRQKNKVYTFYRLNAGHSKESDESIIDKMLGKGNDVLSIEHIMPQRLSDEWRSSLGDNADTIHTQWLNSIANLTLTGYNSSYSNGTFHYKLEEVTDDKGNKVGFKYSPLHLNCFISKQTQWGENELKQRLKLILDEAVSIWYVPISTYQPQKKVYNELTLDDETDDFTNHAFIDCSIDGTTIALKENISWKKVLKTIVEIFDKKHHYELEQIAKSSNNSVLYSESTKTEYCEEVLPGIYAYQKGSTYTKINILKELCKLLDIDPQTIVFHVREYE